MNDIYINRYLLLILNNFVIFSSYLKINLNSKPICYLLNSHLWILIILYLKCHWFFKVIILKFLFLIICVLVFDCMYLQHVCAWCRWRQELNTGSLEPQLQIVDCYHVDSVRGKYILQEQDVSYFNVLYSHTWVRSVYSILAILFYTCMFCYTPLHTFVHA